MRRATSLLVSVLTVAPLALVGGCKTNMGDLEKTPFGYDQATAECVDGGQTMLVRLLDRDETSGASTGRMYREVLELEVDMEAARSGQPVVIGPNGNASLRIVTAGAPQVKPQGEQRILAYTTTEAQATGGTVTVRHATCEGDISVEGNVDSLVQRFRGRDDVRVVAAFRVGARAYDDFGEMPREAFPKP